MTNKTTTYKYSTSHHGILPTLLLLHHKRSPPRQQHEQRTPGTPNIALGSVRLRRNEFGRNEGGSSALGFHFVGIVEGETTGEAEIGEFHVGIVVLGHD